MKIKKDNLVVKRDRSAKVESKYPKKDSRRIFEKGQFYDWEKIYNIAAVIAKEFAGYDLEDKSVKMSLSRCLGSLIRYSTDFCGELNGFEISAAAKEKYIDMGRIDWSKNGPHYMEHLIPIKQFTDELIKNHDLENVKKLYKKQRIVITLRDEQKKYDTGSFKIYRSDKDIKEFKIKYGVTKFIEK